MSNQMSKGKKALLLITLFLSNTIVMADCVMNPTVNTLYVMFPDNVNLINWGVSGAYAICILLSLIIGKLCRKFSKKSLLMVGALSAIVGGVGMIFVISPWGFAICRTLIIAGYSFSITASMAFIPELFSDEMECAKVVSYYNASGAVIGAVLSLAAGVLATISLKSAYSLNFAFVLYFVFLVLFVPNIKPSTKAADADNKVKSNEKLGGKYWLTLINYCVYTFAFCAILYFLSVYVAENALGNEALSGALNTAITVIGFVFSMLFAGVYKKLGSKIAVLAYILTFASIMLLRLYPSVLTAYIGFGIYGGANAILRIFHYSYFPTIVPESRIPDSIAVLESCSTGISCLTAYLVTWGMSALKTELFTVFLIIPIVALVINCIVSTVMFSKKSA